MAHGIDSPASAFNIAVSPSTSVLVSLSTVQEVVQCLERAVGAQQELREALQASAGAGAGGDGGPTAWTVLLRELRAAASHQPAAAGAAKADADDSAGAGRASVEGAGGDRARRGFLLARERETKKAALVLLGELEPLEKPEVCQKNKQWIGRIDRKGHG